MPDVQPTNNPVPSDHPADARDNFKRIDEVLNLQSIETNPTRTGKRLRTLYGLESRYTATPINGGIWAAGIEFTAYNQYMSFNGVTYKPSFSTPLPYETQSADPTGLPDSNFVEPFSEINSTNLSDYTDIIYKPSGGSSAVENMFNENPIASVVGDILKTGGTTWVKYQDSGAVNEDNFRALNCLSVFDFNILPGSSFSVTNCDSYVKLAEYINSKGGFVSIFWPPSEDPYEFSPKDNANFNSTDNSWRIAAELVDVKKVYHYGYGASLHLIADSSWFRGNSNTGSGAVSIGMDESPIQFRSSVQGGCSEVGVKGLEVFTDATQQDSTPTYSDGTAFGVSYRGCDNTITEDVTVRLFGTDGVYFGTDYSNSFKGKNHHIKEPKLIGNYRQGISVVGNDNGVIIGGEISDTIGSTFGYAVDFEPNGSVRQSNWAVIGLKTNNNERGACNHIRSENIRWIGCEFDEQRDSGVNSGCTRIDGSLNAATLTNSISFKNCKITGLRATVYLNGDYFDDVTYDDCTFLCTGDVNSASQFRINAGDNANVGTVRITNSRISGNGGLNARGVTGGLPTKIVFEGNEWFPSDEVSTTQEWLFDTNSEFVEAEVKDNTIDFTRNTWSASGNYQPYIPSGVLEENTFESTSSYTVEWRDWGAGREVEIGMNTWGEYSYYDGVVSSLDMKSMKSAVQRLEVAGGDFGLARRVVHGGRQRIIAYNANPANFVNQQAPQDGDMLWNLANNAAGIPQTSYVYDSAFGGWRVNSWVTLIGSTAARPNTSQTQSEDVGVQYLDTTLGANGILITWNGSDWVNTSGAIV